MFVEIRKELMNREAANPLPLVLSSIGISEEQEPINRPNGSKHHHLIWVTEGSGVFQVNDRNMVLYPGEGLFTRRDVPHSYGSEGHFRTEWLTFVGGDGLLEYFGIGDYLQFQIPQNMQVSAAALRLVCEGNSTVIGRSAAGYTWLADFFTEIMAPYKQPEQIVREYMEAHYGEPLTLEDIAAQVNMSRYGLCHYYARTQGIRVMEELKRIRIAKAKELLRFTDLPAAQIGSLCGFESASYFGKQFKEQTGRTPGEYRTKRR